MAYFVPPHFVREFTPSELDSYKRVFQEFDPKKAGRMASAELSLALNKLGQNITRVQLQAVLTDIGRKGSPFLEWPDFLAILEKVHKHDMPPTPPKPASSPTQQVAAATAAVKQLHIHEMRGSSGGTHSFSDEEKIAFTEHINNCLRHDKELSKILPMDSHSMALFSGVQDGILLCKLINLAVPETIDERALNKKDKLNIYEKTENQNLCINAAKSIGCSVVNIGAQIVKIQLTSTITLKHHPELIRLLEPGEDLADLMKLPPELILLRWINFHLKAAGSTRRVNNFSSDIQDSEAYSILLHQIAPQTCDLASETDVEQRAAHVIENAKRLKVEVFLLPRDITSGNRKLNLAFAAQIFNTCPGLTVTEQEVTEMAEVLDDDVGDSREERVFRMWINSLGLEDVYVNNLFADLRDGVIILKVMDRVEPGLVHWPTVNFDPKNRFKKVENGNYCVVLGKQLKFSLVNVGGVDIIDGNKKLILALIWQLMRHHILKILSSLSKRGGYHISDQDIVSWANNKVQQGGRRSRMVAFRDPSLSNGQFLLDLVYSIENRAVDWSVVAPGSTDEEKMNNAKYAISVARKIGATVFLTWEDIVEVKSKMILTFVAVLMTLSP